MIDYKVCLLLNEERIIGHRNITIYYVRIKQKRIFEIYAECRIRNIKLIKITHYQFYIMSRTLDRQPKYIIDYFLQNGIDKTKELLYH